MSPVMSSPTALMPTRTRDRDGGGTGGKISFRMLAAYFVVAAFFLLAAFSAAAADAAPDALVKSTVDEVLAVIK